MKSYTSTCLPQIESVLMYTDKRDNLGLAIFCSPATCIMKAVSNIQEPLFERFCMNCYYRTLNCIGGDRVISSGNCLASIEKEDLTELRSYSLNIPNHVMIYRCGNWSMFYFDEDQEGFKPLTLGNVRDNGEWCTGSISFNHHADIVDHYIRFFGFTNGDYSFGGYTRSRMGEFLENISNDFNWLPEYQEPFLEARSLESILKVNDLDSCVVVEKPKQIVYDYGLTQKTGDYTGYLRDYQYCEYVGVKVIT